MMQWRFLFQTWLVSSWMMAGVFTGCGSPDTGGRVTLCSTQPVSTYSIRRKMLSFISGPLFNGCGGVSVIATTRYECGCDERGNRFSVNTASSCELKSNLEVRHMPDIVIRTLRVTLLSDSGYALTGYEY